jgi:hypothetical protein
MRQLAGLVLVDQPGQHSRGPSDAASAAVRSSGSIASITGLNGSSTGAARTGILARPRGLQPLRTCQMITAPPRKQAPIEMRWVAVWILRRVSGPS